MQEELVFQLENPIEVQSKQDGKNVFVKLDKIYLKAPTYKHKDITINLKKKFIEAIFSMTSSLNKDQAEQAIESNKNDGLDEKAIKAVLFAAKDFDIASFFSYFTKLLNKVAFKDEEMQQPFPNMEIEKINENDFEDLIAKYIEVFFIASWMKTLA